MITVTWEVEDGYVGASRPHTTEIDPEDLEGLEGAARQHEIYARVQEDFEQDISWSIISIKGDDA